MRMIVVDEPTDLEGLRTQVLGSKAVSAATIERLKSLNPHVSFDKIPAGTVLFVPDRPGVRKRATSPVTGDAFATLRETLLGAVDAARDRVHGGHAALAAQQKEVGTAMKSAAFRRALESDPDLRHQVEAAAEVFKQDREQASAADEILNDLKEEAAAELASLAELLQ